MAKRPNIVIFNPDQMRRDALHHMGNDASITPNLDAFAENDAVSFRYAFCQNPVCVPSRCSFLTGLYPHVHGHRTMSHMIHDHQTTLFRELKDEGYYVWLNDRNDFLPAQDNGYYDKHADFVFPESYITQKRYKSTVPRGNYGDRDYYSFYRGRSEIPEGEACEGFDELCAEAAVDFISTRCPENEQPFCLFLGLVNPHPTYAVEEPYFSAIDRKKLSPRLKNVDFADKPSILGKIQSGQMIHDYTEDDWNELRACYLGMCMKVDHLFGMLCQALKKAGIYDDTDIYFFSDHGDFTGDYGITEKSQNTFEDCLTNVPFLIKPHKGVQVDPGVSDSIVELVDFYATALDLSGTKPTHTHFGISLRDVMSDRGKTVRDYATCEGGRLAEETHCSESANGAPGKAQEYYPRLMAQRDPVCHTKATMLRNKEYKYVRRLYEKDELYDMVADPHETKNLIDDASLKDIVAQLRLAMLDWYQKTCDVVPFKTDSRFNPLDIWISIKSRISLPPGEIERTERSIRQGSFSLADIITLMRENSKG